VLRYVLYKVKTEIGLALVLQRNKVYRNVSGGRARWMAATDGHASSPPPIRRGTETRGLAQGRPGENARSAGKAGFTANVFLTLAQRGEEWGAFLL
jgi:hypothetical protein